MGIFYTAGKPHVDDDYDYDVVAVIRRLPPPLPLLHV